MTAAELSSLTGVYVSADADSPESCFYYKVWDESMSPSIPKNSLAFIHKQKKVNSGEIALVLYQNKCILRKIFKKDSTQILQPINLSDYDPIIITEDNSKELDIIGKVTHTLSRTNW